MDESGAKLIAHDSFDLEFMRPKTAKPEVSVRDLQAQEEQDASEAAEAGEEPGDAHAHSHAHSAPVNPWAGRTPWGGDRPRPTFKMRMRFRMMRLLGRAMRLPDVTDPVSEGDVIRLAGREWFIVHTPGHTEDHICLHDPADRIFLAGDHVLPTITPHISGLSSNDDPLAAFFDSLDRAAATQHVSQVLPAHGHPFEDLKARCEAIKVHHDERLGKVRSIARDLGPATVQAFTERLFKQRSWGPMAESETYAHLEHIRLLGEADRHQNPDGKLIYVL
jgi:glyoxylase-like metal-dependent hydrolase (beta-lactamase superfamily II)